MLYSAPGLPRAKSLARYKPRKRHKSKVITVTSQQAESREHEIMTGRRPGYSLLSGMPSPLPRCDREPALKRTILSDLSPNCIPIREWLAPGEQAPAPVNGARR
jgi:hypothetical protein